jgi:tRNA A-37 threonylcarbamoyl transferase component Bud32
MSSFRSDQRLPPQIDKACRGFAQRLRLGLEPQIEQILGGIDDSNRSACLRSLLLVELDVLQNGDHLPSVDDYLRRFPNDKPIVLEAFLQALSEQATQSDSALDVTTNENQQPAETRNPIETLDVSETHTFRNTPTAANTAETGLRFFGDYELLEPIARGGMGVVYKARQRRLNRIVALKMILAGELASAEQIRRFYVEAEAAAKLDHPGIVPVFEVGQVGNQHFYSMAFVEGASVATPLKSGRYPPKLAAQIVAQVADAIHYAHQQGVIHRDLKPQNVLIDGQGRPRVTDFGLARNVAFDSTLTASGQVMGTPSYMPPEQALGRVDSIGPAADIYSLGATLYHLITGEVPFRAATPMDTLLLVLESDPIPPRQLHSEIPRDLETICLKCLQKSPAQRFESARALAEDLRRFLANEPILARPVTRLERLAKWARRRPAIAGLLTACTLALIGYGFVAMYLYKSNPDRLRAEAAKTTAIADLRAAEAERIAAEADRLNKEQQKDLLDIQREARKGLDMKAAWAQLVLDLQSIHDRHTKTETRIVNSRPRRSYDPFGSSHYDPLGGMSGNLDDPLGSPSKFGRFDSFGRFPGSGAGGFASGPVDPRTGRMNEFDPSTGRWRSPSQQPQVEMNRYIVLTDAYRNEILNVLNKALDSLQFDERRAEFWQNYVKPNQQKYFRDVEETDRFKELQAKYSALFESTQAVDSKEVPDFASSPPDPDNSTVLTCHCQAL